MWSAITSTSRFVMSFVLSLVVPPYRRTRDMYIPLGVPTSLNRHGVQHTKEQERDDDPALVHRLMPAARSASAMDFSRMILLCSDLSVLRSARLSFCFFAGR